jgi:hypothetical protein
MYTANLKHVSYGRYYNACKNQLNAEEKDGYRSYNYTHRKMPPTLNSMTIMSQSDLLDECAFHISRNYLYLHKTQGP